jgi:nitrous oxidase accessory protein
MKIILTILFFITLSSTAYTRIITVGKGQTVNSITKAIQLSKNGDSIQVMPGIYREGSITIKKSITLIGINYPTLDGENKHENIIISGNNITVKGFIILNSKKSSSTDYSGINVIDATNIKVENNRILNAHFAIHLANTTHSSVIGNEIKGQAVSEQSAGNGIHIWKCDNILVKKNNITGHRDGIYFEFVTDSEIRENISEKNIRYGLHFMFSHNDKYFNNVFRNNGAGVAVMYTHDVRMENNIFENNWGTASYAILLKDISDSYIINNRFISNSIGIFMEGGNRIEVKRNEFRSNGWALRVQANCTDNIITQNNFFQNTFDVATNGTAVMSSFNNNYWDKYEGYDINKNGIGDVPYHPVSLYSMIIEQNPHALLLLRSFMVNLLDKAEKAIPSLTPENLFDKSPMMKPFKL